MLMDRTETSRSAAIETTGFACFGRTRHGVVGRHPARSVRRIPPGRRSRSLRSQCKSIRSCVGMELCAQRDARAEGALTGPIPAVEGHRRKRMRLTQHMGRVVSMVALAFAAFAASGCAASQDDDE